MNLSKLVSSPHSQGENQLRRRVISWLLLAMVWSTCRSWYRSQGFGSTCCCHSHLVDKIGICETCMAAPLSWSSRWCPLSHPLYGQRQHLARTIFSRLRLGSSYGPILLPRSPLLTPLHCLSDGTLDSVRMPRCFCWWRNSLDAWTYCLSWRL